MTGPWSIESVETDLDHFRLGPVDLTIAPGGAVAVLGASGAGKTTLLRTIAGFLRPRRGRIVRDGVDVTDWPPEARSLGYVPQGLGLFPHRTAAGNVRYPMELKDRPGAEARTLELLERFDLAKVADRRPAKLSGGELQRVALARAIAADPQLIVWDEPSQGLDVLARHELGLVLHDLREVERIPVVLVTHDPSLAFSIADSFLVLEEGRVRDQCDAATLLAAPGDPFAARFVGFENVFDPDALSGGATGSFRSWLLERAGPRGVAFSGSTRPPPGGPGARWEGIVRSARPSPEGLSLELALDTLGVSLRQPRPLPSPIPRAGTRFLFSLDPADVHPLGARRALSPGVPE